MAGKDASPNTETYTSLIYACVKFRQLDEGFQHFEAMMAAGILPDCRTYAHLIKGCGRTKQLRRGASFFELLKQRNAPEVFTLRVYNAMINMCALSSRAHTAVDGLPVRPRYSHQRACAPVRPVAGTHTRRTAARI